MYVNQFRCTSDENLGLLKTNIPETKQCPLKYATKRKAYFYLRKHKNAYILAAQIALSANQATAENTHNDNAQISKAVASGGASGAITGGPFGFAIGAIGSALINDQVIRHKNKNTEKTKSVRQIVGLQEELID